MSAYRREYNARVNALDSSDSSDTKARPASPTPTGDASGPKPQPYTVTAPDWDEEAIETARDQAAMLLDMDPNDPTAMLLLEKARLAEMALRGETLASPSVARAAPRQAFPAAFKPPESVFDPMQLFAQLAKYYHWSDRDIRETPWKRLLGYKREAERMIEQEQAAYDKAKRDAKSGSSAQAMVDGQVVDPAYAEAQLGGYVSHAQTYDGPIVALHE